MEVWRPKLRALLLGLLLLSLAHTIAAAHHPSPKYARGRVLVTYKPAADQVVHNMGVAKSAASGPQRANRRTHLLKITDGKGVLAKIQELQSEPNVLYVEPDYELRLFTTPNDPQYSGQWHHPKIASPTAWASNVGSPQVKVCIIDSGLRMDHPDLAASVVTGWNVAPVVEGGPYPVAGQPDYLNYNDTLGHGTHVAGLVGAIGNNAAGVAGVTWQTALMPCRFISNPGVGYVSDAITCLHLCRAEGAHVYSTSWGGVGYSQSLQAEIDAVEGVFVTAAGNNMGLDLDVGPLYPAAFNSTNLITVAATTAADALAAFSNFGKTTVHLAAPGENLLSTQFDGNYGLMSGTSMSTPLVAGAAALLQSVAMSAGQPPLPPQAIRMLLLSSVDLIPGGADKLVSGGRLNVGRAVQKLNSQLAALKPHKAELSSFKGGGQGVKVNRKPLGRKFQ